MVYGVLIHSVASSQKLFFSNFYTPEGNNESKKIRQQTIMRRVLEEHLFQMHFASGANLATSAAAPKRPAGANPPSGAPNNLSEDDWFFLQQNDAKVKSSKSSQRDLTEGVVRLQAKAGLFDTPKIIAWKQVDQIAYTMVLESHENPLMATTFLTILVHEITRAIVPTKGGGGSDVDSTFVDRPDQVLVILHHLLPGGQLLFMNHALYSNLRDQCEEILKN